MITSILVQYDSGVRKKKILASTVSFLNHGMDNFLQTKIKWNVMNIINKDVKYLWENI